MARCWRNQAGAIQSARPNPWHEPCTSEGWRVGTFERSNVATFQLIIELSNVPTCQLKKEKICPEDQPRMGGTGRGPKGGRSKLKPIITEATTKSRRLELL